MKQLISYQQLMENIITKKAISVIPEDTLDYLDYNTAVKLPSDIEGYPVYFITSEANNNPFKLDPETIRDTEETPEVLQEKLNGLKRLQMFKRISHRAGLASFDTRKQISQNHK